MSAATRPSPAPARSAPSGSTATRLPGQLVAPDFDTLAARIEAGFAAAAGEAVQHAHAAEVPVAVLGRDGAVAWLHPDGTTRPGDGLHAAPPSRT